MNNIKYFLVVQLLFSYCLCGITNDQKEKFLNGFKEYYNSLPNQVYRSEEGSLLSTQQVDDTTFQIVTSLRVREINNVETTKLLKCTATVKDSDNDITVINNNCEDAVEEKQSSDENQEAKLETQVEVSEPTVERKPVQLVNEVQADTAITSGEQFIAIPRDQPSAPCVGCATHVNPQAAGVSDLANLGVRHLDLHEPYVKHSLDSVIDVERQVQVVNGVRYVLTLSINSNNCTEIEAENCASSKICKITILVKPWVKLSNGGNYRAVLANNCTEEWLFGDNGEVLPELSADNIYIKGNTSVNPKDGTGIDGDIQVKHNTNLESQPNQERTLTDEDIKKIQEQIISNTQFNTEVTESQRQSFTLSPEASDASKQHVFKVESTNHKENSIPVTESEKAEQAFNANLDKKKAIDELLDFFDFAGFKPKSEAEDVVSRVRRSYDYDLQVLSLAQDYHGIKSSIENARFMYEMAQAMVDYLNEMDMEIKNRAVEHVVKAEEETENLQRFVYIQARVTIPCDKVECDKKDVDIQICNGVIECSNENNPQILNTFCYNDNKESDNREDIKEISLGDPVLRRMAEEALEKIESESKSQYAMKINKIASAITQVQSGTLTKFSLIVENIKCNKSVPLPLRINCTVLEQLGTKICDVIVLERHWLKEKKVSYTCTERPADMRISKSKKMSKNVTVDDPEIIDMLQEAIQYLESQSVKTNKQKIVNVKSISSQIIAGFLTKIEFVVGYTDCTDENYSRDQINKCELLKGEGLRSCRAQIWDRSWIMDGRQIEVACDDASKTNEIVNTRKKRSFDSASDQEQRSLSKDNDIDYKKLANESLYKYMQSSSSHQHYEVVKVDKATVQDISRKLIKIDFSISPTDCVIQNDGILSSSECEIVNPKNILHCHSKILKNNWIDKNQYFVKCNIKYPQKKNTNVLKERNPNDSKYYQLAEESLAKYLHDTGNPHHIIVNVEKVTTQIVSGLLTRIDFVISPKNHSVSKNKTVRCHSEILEKRWMETKVFNVSCEMKIKERLVKTNSDNPKYMQIAVESLQKYIKNKPESNLVRVAFVDKVEQKGDQIKIGFIASHAEEGDGDTFCYAEVSETRGSKSDIEVKCYLIGKIYRKAEITEDNPNYQKYVQLADESLRNYLEKINSSLYTLVSIKSIAVQWDEGIKTLIDFTISSIDSENSELIQGKQCTTEILEQPWLQKKNIEVKCELEKDLYRTKRQTSNSRTNGQSVLGGVTEHDPSNSEYKMLAEESLRKYIVESGITHPLQVACIEKVTTQVVSGTLTRIDFLASGSPDSETIKCHSKVWEQSWRNFKEIEVSCEKSGHRGKRDMPGGLKDQDPTDPKYQALAQESLRKYAVDSGITQPLQVARIEKVTTQVVAGTLTRIDFLGSGNPDSEAIKCHSEVWEQGWRNFKEIKVSCRSDSHLRGKRQVGGGYIDQDPTEPEYRALAEESLRKYAIDSGITQPLEVARVERVSTAVAAGITTSIDFLISGSPDSKLIKCHSEVWEQSWRNFKEIEVSCEKSGHREKRDMPGGLKDQDPTDPKYQALAEESLRKYAVDSGITQPLQVARIEKVTTQVVAGTLTRIDFLGSGNPDSEAIKCHSEVWEQGWRNFKEIKVSCRSDSHLRGKRQVGGGYIDQDPTEPEYRALAEESLRKYAIDSGITQPLEVARVERVSTAVAAGITTSIDFLISGSPDSKLIKCHSEVWEQSWRNFKEIEVSCEKSGHRGKRDIPGGLKDQDPTDPKYQALAEESLRKYAVDSGITQPLQVARIEKVTTQVVAGTLTRIDFLGSGNPDSEAIKCHSEVWEQGWRNFKEIKVFCEKNGHRGKRDMLGGLKDQDPTDPEYQALAQESLRKYAVDSGITQPLQVARIEKVTTQVVAGTLTRIDFLGSGNPDSEAIKCHSEVWEQGWRNFKEIKVSCRSDSHLRGKRQVGGGYIDQDPTEPEYRALAEESLRKYAIDSGITQPLEVARVERVSTAVAAGITTSIDFLISGSPDSKLIKCHSEVWEQSWRNFKEIEVSCEKSGHRGKRDIPGGLKDQDPTDPKYQALAEESLRKYAVDSGITQPLQVARIEKVTTQVVAGTLTRIDFLGSGNPDSEAIKCHSEVWEQGWRNFKEIKVSCEKNGHRGKRDMLGGLKDQDPTDPEYQALAQESLRKYAVDSGITQPLQVARIEKVTTQVVAGTLTRIDFLGSGNPDSEAIKCHSEVWEQGWRNFKEIKVSCRSDSHLRGKRQVGGGYIDQDPTEPEYRALAEESLRKYAIDSGITQPLEVARVERVSTAVAAGITTSIDFLISGSPDSKLIKCHSEVWEQSWRNFKEIEVSCEKSGHRGKRDIPGGLKDQDPTDPKYQALAEESLRKYAVDSGITQPLQVARIEKVTTQVVAGTLTRIDFLGSGNPDSEAIKCHSEVWEQGWRNFKEIKVSCEKNGHRGKRDMLGGLKDQDPTDPEYQALAQESLRKYAVDSGITQPLQVARIEKVTTQVVAGTLTRIDFLGSGNPDSEAIKCHSEVWEQGWRNFKEIKVSCRSDSHLRGKRQVGGGYIDQDPTEPEYRALAEESLRKYAIDSGITQPLEVARVERVSTAVAAGITTSIDFLISGSPDSKLIKCHSEVWEQGWRNFKKIEVSCENDGQSSKRQMVGGISEADPTAPQYKALAEESLRKYMIESAIAQPLEVVRVQKVTTQVVAGSLTRIVFLVSSSPYSETMKCHSEIWNRPWLKKKDIKVSCIAINERIKRDLRFLGAASEDNLITSQFKVLATESIRGNSSTQGQQYVGILRGHSDEEQDPSKPEYKTLAEESLRKLYHKKSTVYHKVVEVHRVVTHVVSGLKYKIDFTAAPTACSANVSSIRARSCKADSDVLLYCHSDVWDQPWLKKKTIVIQCNGNDDEPTSDNDGLAEDQSEIAKSLKPKHNDKYIKLAEEASEKYLTTSNRKYVHKVTEILNASEEVANGTLTNIDYSLSPTTCLRNETTNSTSCKLKQPLVVFTCNANIRIRPSLHAEKEITVTCKKNSKTNDKKRKPVSGVRNIREIIDDDDELDEDTTYYYADRAVQHINDKSSSNNLHKLISIHAVQSSVQMRTLTVKMFIEVAETFCLRHHKSKDLRNCEEMGGLKHRLCLARLWPSPDDELIVRHVSVVCDDEEDFVSVTGVNIPELIRISVAFLESPPDNKFKLVHQGEPQVIPSLDSRRPFKLHFIVGITNCSKDVNLDKNPFQCFLNPNVPARSCHAFIWLKAEVKYITNVDAQCTPVAVSRFKRSALDPEKTSEYSEIQKMVTAALEQLEMQSVHRYKQRVLQINSHSTKITSGKVTTIDFDVGYTSCLKYEWIVNITSCNFLDHLPRRRCVAQIWERLWISNGKNIDVNCVDDETPLESHIEFESAEMANELAKQALKHIEAKYPHPSKQKIVRIFSLEKQVVAGIHYKMKVEVGFTDCLALSDQKDCKLTNKQGVNKFCRVNVWIRPWTEHPPNFRVSCDFQEGTTRDLYHHVQAEHLFFNFLTTYSPSYVNDYSQMHKRFEIFKSNIKKIHELNVHEKGTAVYGVTRFTDLSYEEFSSTYMGLKTNLTNENQVPMKKADIPNIKVPPNFDWRDYDAVTDVKDQGSCGSCWAFSVTGNIEGQWKMQSGQLVSLSEQELVDCDKLDNGCNGGLPDNAYRAIEQMGGLELESDYPYEGTDDKCAFNKTLAKVKISSAVNITTNETGMAQWLVHNGPISIGINANAMQFYMGGISHPWKMLCNPTNLDHGVLIVGFGVKDYPLFHKQLPYWIIKNSWGKSWGEQGYYRVYRGDGTCGVNQMASSAVI